LNTLKSSADTVLNDGFAGMDLRRICAIKAIDLEVVKKLRPKRGSRIALEEKVKEQSIQIAALEARNMTLTYYIRELQSLAADVALSCSSNATKIRHKRNLEVIHTKLSASGENSLVVLKDVSDGS